MKVVTGELTNVEIKGPKEGKFGKGDYYIHEYTIDDEVFMKFSQTEEPIAYIGQEVTIYYEVNKTEKGTTNKIIKMVVNDSGPTPDKPTGTKATPKPSAKPTSKPTTTSKHKMSDDTQNRISRSHAITSALKAMEIAGVFHGDEPNNIIEAAIKYSANILAYTSGAD